MGHSARRVVRHAALLARAGLGLEPVHEIDDVEEAAAGAVADEGACDGDGEVGLAGAGSTDQDDVALIGHEVASRKVMDQSFVDRGVGEAEVVDVLCQGQFGDGHLVADRPPCTAPGSLDSRLHYAAHGRFWSSQL